MADHEQAVRKIESMMREDPELSRNIAEGMAEQAVNALEGYLKKNGHMPGDECLSGLGAPQVVILGQDGRPFAVLPDCQIGLTEEPLPEEVVDDWNRGFTAEVSGSILAEPGNVQQLMGMLSRSMRFDRKTLRKLFHAVTHHKQVWFDVVIEFKDGSVDEGGLIVKTPHQLRFLLNKIHHIRTPYKISDREE